MLPVENLSLTQHPVSFLSDECLYKIFERLL